MDPIALGVVWACFVSCFFAFMVYLSNKTKQDAFHRKIDPKIEVESRKSEILNYVAKAVALAKNQNDEKAITSNFKLPTHNDFRNDIIELLKEHGCTMCSVFITKPLIDKGDLNSFESKNYRGYYILIHITPQFINFNKATFLTMAK